MTAKIVLKSDEVFKLFRSTRLMTPEFFETLLLDYNQNCRKPYSNNRGGISVKDS